MDPHADNDSMTMAAEILLKFRRIEGSNGSLPAIVPRVIRLQCMNASSYTLSMGKRLDNVVFKNSAAAA